LTSFVAIIGYLYGASSFYLIVSFNPMAIHSAVSFCCWRARCFYQTRDREYIKEIFSPHPGGQTARRLFPLFIIIPVILGWMRFIRREKRGLFGAEMGTSLLIVVLSLFLA
jgi:hypothetical protein